MTDPAAVRAPGGAIRSLAADDLDAIVRLHRSCFDPETEVPTAELRSHLRELFFEHPWPDPRLPSLVYEDSRGELVGCLGVMPRPMALGEKRILAAISHDFMVAPARRGSLAAMELMRTFLSGPQDLSLAEGNDASRRLWVAMGGEIAVPYSFRWTRSIRPASHALARALGEGSGGTRRLLRPLARLADRAAAWPRRSPFRSPPTELDEEPVEGSRLAECIESAAREKALRPVYDGDSLEGMFGILDRCPGRESLRRRILRRDGVVRGWYLYHPRRDGTGSVVQAAVASAGSGDVLDHLFRDARSLGSVALSGLLDPDLMPLLSERACLFHRGRNASWLLVHGPAADAVRALRQGDAWFTHLEGEFWV